MVATNGNSSKVDQFRNDAALGDVFSSISNTNSAEQQNYRSGLGYRLSKLACEELYRIPICRRVCRAKADAAILKGWEVTLGGKSSQKIIAAYNAEAERLKIASRFNEAQVLANLYKGAVAIINIDDGRHWSEPVDEKNIKKIRSIRVLDCYKIYPVIDGTVFNVAEPTYYQLSLPAQLRRMLGLKDKGQEKDLGTRQDYIHHTRIIRFDGIALPPDMMTDGWGMSLLDSIWEDFCDWKSSLKSMKSMLEGFSVFTYKIAKLGDLIDEFGEDALKQRFQAFKLGIEVLGAAAIDKDNEDISYTARQMGGVDGVADRLRDAFIGATGLPHTKLFGESPSGLGATGESEEKDWSASIAAFQQGDWHPKLRPLIRLIFLSKEGPSKGKEPEDWSIKFHNLIQQSESDIATVRSTQAQTDNTYLSAGILLPDEIRNSRFGGSEYSIETVLDPVAWEKSKEEQSADAFGGDFGGGEEALPPAEELPVDEGAIAATAEEPVLDSIAEQREDSAPPIKRVIRWQGLNLGITHDPGDSRFEGSLPLVAHYGHLRRSFGHAEDGLAHDFYVQPNTDLEQAKLFKIRQNHPATGFKDEDKYAIASNADIAKSLYIYHAGRDRFGGIDPVDITELGQYRTDTHLDTCDCEVCHGKKKRRKKKQRADAEDKDIADYLVEKAVEEANPILGGWLNSTKSWMNGMNSLEEMRDKIPELFTRLKNDDFVQLVEQSNLLAHLEGINSAEDQQ